MAHLHPSRYASLRHKYSFYDLHTISFPCADKLGASTSIKTASCDTYVEPIFRWAQRIGWSNTLSRRTLWYGHDPYYNPFLRTTQKPRGGPAQSLAMERMSFSGHPTSLLLQEPSEALISLISLRPRVFWERPCIPLLIKAALRSPANVSLSLELAIALPMYAKTSS